MGGMAAQKFAEENKVRALVLIAPVVPVEAGGRFDRSCDRGGSRWRETAGLISKWLTEKCF